MVKTDLNIHIDSNSFYSEDRMIVRNIMDQDDWWNNINFARENDASLFIYFLAEFALISKILGMDKPCEVRSMVPHPSLFFFSSNITLLIDRIPLVPLFAVVLFYSEEGYIHF